MTRRDWLAGAAPLLLAACGRYDDYTLPVQDGEPGPALWQWQPRAGPVLGRGAEGEWDSVDVLNPSVVQRPDGYYNFYSGFDGKTWHTGLAISSDGIQWTKRGKVLSPDPATWESDYIAANGAALWVNNEFLYWYQAGPYGVNRLGLARSTNGRDWSKRAQPVVGPGPRGSWDERGVGDPYVLQAGGHLYLFYLGQDRARRQRLGIARSLDGVTWSKLRSNPILELGPPGAFDENGLGEPAVWSTGGRYWMLYTGRARSEERSLGLARSTDGIRWERMSVFAGSEAWNSKVLCDATVAPTAEGVRVWFGGGDLAHPAERIHGQIGFGLLAK